MGKIDPEFEEQGVTKKLLNLVEKLPKEEKLKLLEEKLFSQEKKDGRYR